MPDGIAGISVTGVRSITELLSELNRYLDSIGQPKLTKTQIPSGSEGFRFLDQQIERARGQWQSQLSWWERPLAQMGFGAPIAQPAQLAPGVAEKAAEGEAARIDLGLPAPPGEAPPTGFEMPGFETFADAFQSIPNENWEVYKTEFGRFDIRRKQAPTPLPTGLTPAQEVAQRQARLTREQREREFGITEERAGEQARLTAEFRRTEEARAAEAAGLTAEFRTAGLAEEARQFDIMRQQQQQQFGIQGQQFGAQLQFQQEQALLQADLQRQQEGARLAAQPISWLQSASFTGEAPLTQPWMIPLGQQGGGQLQVGEPLLQEGQTFANLPQLTTPSAQLQARWGPTAQAQFLGYRQARTGATPQETQFRLGSGAAPTGQFGGFTRFR